MDESRRLWDELAAQEALKSGIAEASARGLDVSPSELSVKLTQRIDSAKSEGCHLSDVELAAVLSTYLSNQQSGAQP